LCAVEGPAILEIPVRILARIIAHGEASYPHEGVGLLLGFRGQSHRRVEDVLILANVREDSARHNRYLVSPEDTLRAEEEADHRGLEVIGVFHSHPDHPSSPSEFDREWALPWFSYVITCVEQGRAIGTRSWQLKEDRSGFEEEQIVTVASTPDPHGQAA
jgi:proteasome lid subunit RPN8/RPN11